VTTAGRNGTTRLKRAEARLERGFVAFLQSLTTLVFVVYCGRWAAWCYVVGLLVLTAAYGLYVLGMKRAADDA
jgi:Ca2+/Na+ antiporter